MEPNIRFNEETDTWIVQGDSHEFTFCHSRKALEELTKRCAKELGWETGPSQVLNPSNLPRPVDLENACRSHLQAYPHLHEPGFPAMLTSFTIINTYITWLPENHRIVAQRAVSHIESRIEELVIFHRFIRQIRQFINQPATIALAHAMMRAVKALAQEIKEKTGVDLWSRDG